MMIAKLALALACLVAAAATQHPDPGTVAALLREFDALGDAPEAYRIEAVYACASFRHPELRDRLVREWRGAESLVFRAAVMGNLSVYGDDQAVQRIGGEVIAAERDWDSTLVAAATVLTHDVDRGVAQLIGLVVDGRPRQRRAAAIALRGAAYRDGVRDAVLARLRTAPPAAHSSLLQILTASAPTSALRDWLDAHSEHPDPAARIQVLAARSMFDGALSRRDRERVEGLLQLDRGATDPQLRAALAVAVAARRTPRDLETVATLLGGERRPWHEISFRDTVRRHDLDKFLIDGFRTSRDPGVRRLALDLAIRNYAELRRLALDDRDPSVTLHALLGRGHYGADPWPATEFAAQLHRVLSRSRGWPVVEQAGLVTALRAEHVSADPRAAAAWQRTLLEWLARDEPEFVIAGLQAARRLGLRAAARSATALLRHDDPLVRRAAVDCAAHLQDMSAAEPLLAIFETASGRIAADAHAALASITGRRYRNAAQYRALLDTPDAAPPDDDEQRPSIALPPGLPKRRIGEIGLNASRVCIVLDRSGRMSDRHSLETATLLDAAKDLIRGFVDTDQPSVSMELVVAGDRPEPLFGGLRALDRTARDRVGELLDELEPRGECDLLAAVSGALSLPDVEAVVMILGGPATVGEITLEPHLAHRFDTLNLRAQARLVVLRANWDVSLPELLADDGARTAFY